MLSIEEQMKTHIAELKASREQFANPSYSSNEKAKLNDLCAWHRQQINTLKSRKRYLKSMIDPPRFACLQSGESLIK